MQGLRFRLCGGWSLRIALSALAATSVCAGEAAFQKLSEDAIRHKIIGKVVTDGAHWADHFLRNGQVEGHSLGKRYAGTWRLEDGELCITRRRKRPAEECVEVWVSGTQVEYRRAGAPLASGTLRDGD